MSADPLLIRKNLLAWYRREKRRLPWRGTRDPYRIWISEVMLQQTTFPVVEKRYGPFLARFPDLERLARAPLSRVLAAWSGLGYYARARNLHAAAREVVRRHGGRLPKEPEALERLPGFGPYMAAAVASFAYGRRVAAVDANVARVVSRLFALDGISQTAAHRRDVAIRAAELLPPRRPSDGTAALMDLGQAICTPRNPRCAACPLREECAALASGDPTRYPRRGRRPTPRRAHVAAACAIAGGRVLLLRRADSLLRDLWQFPSAEGRGPAAARHNLRRALAPLGLRLASDARPVVTQHTMVHRHLRIAVYRALRDGVLARPRDVAARWFTPAAMRAAPIPTLTRKIAEAGGFPFARGRRILSDHVHPVRTGGDRLRASG